MTLPYKLRMIGRAERVRSWPEAQQQVDAIRAKIDELVKAVDNLSLNVSSGTSGGVLPHAAFTGAYGTAAVDGALNSYISSNATLPYPSALGVAASPITDMLTLSDDITEGALLTASNTFSVNAAAILAPNATNTLRIGKYGNLAVAGAALSDTTLLRFIKTDYNEAAETVGCNFTLTNTGAGSAVNLVRGLVCVVNATALNAGGAVSKAVVGAAVNTQAGNTTNNNFTGTITGFQLASHVVTAQTIGTAVPTIVSFDAGSATTNLIATRVAITDYIGFRARPGATLLTSAAITNNTGFRCDAITQGTNRYGVDIAAITTGTPTNSMGLQIGAHTAGTNRYGVNIGAFTGGTVATGVEVAAFSGGTTMRSFRGGNTFENTATDFLCSTAAKGFISKDSQGTARYWRMYNEADGTASVGGGLRIDKNGFLAVGRDTSPAGNLYHLIGDVGTTAPAA